MLISEEIYLRTPVKLVEDGLPRPNNELLQRNLKNTNERKTSDEQTLFFLDDVFRLSRLLAKFRFQKVSGMSVFFYR